MGWHASKCGGDQKAGRNLEQVWGRTIGIMRVGGVHRPDQEVLEFQSGS